MGCMIVKILLSTWMHRNYDASRLGEFFCLELRAHNLVGCAFDYESITFMCLEFYGIVTGKLGNSDWFYYKVWSRNVYFYSICIFDGYLRFVAFDLFMAKDSALKQIQSSFSYLKLKATQGPKLTCRR